MECNWGLGDKKPPVYYPHPSPANHAIQGFPPSDLIHVHDAIQLEKMKIRHEIISLHHEIEKEQIRQEILAAETARRRELVVEVMREMAMEREMAKGTWTDNQLTYSPSPFGNPRFHQQSTYGPSAFEIHRFHQQSTYGPSAIENHWFHQQSTYGPSAVENHWFHQQLTMANQTRTIVPSNISPPFALPAGSKVKPSKDKLIVLDKPSQDRFGEKCTAVAPPSVGSGKLIFIGKKPKEEWSCALCRVSAIDERSFNEHLQGRKHKAKEAALRAETYVRKAGSSKLEKKTSFKLADSKALLSDVSQRLKTEDATTKEMEFSCDICDVRTHSEVVMEAHLQGKRHKARLQNQSDYSEVVPTATISLSDSLKELGLQNAAMEEAKMENPTADNVTKVDPTAGEAMWQNPMVEILENPLLEEATRDDSMVEKVRAEDPAADEPREDCNVANEVWEIKAKAEEFISERKKKFDFWCDICEIGTHSEEVMEAHLQGKKHRAKITKLSDCCEANLTTTMLPLKAPQVGRVQNLAVEVEIIENPVVEVARGDKSMVEKVRAEDPAVEAEIVEKPVVKEASGDESMVEKVRAEDPAVDEARGEDSVTNEMQGGMSTEEIKFKTEEIISECKKEFDFWCDICTIGTYSVEVMEVHLQGRRHKARLKKQSHNSEVATLSSADALKESEILSSSDARKESELQNTALEEAKMDNSIQVDLTTQEARDENPMVEVKSVENPVVEEATWDDSMVEKRRAENLLVDESKGEDPTATISSLQPPQYESNGGKTESRESFKESILQNAVLEEDKMENSIKVDLTTQEAKGENPVVEEATGNDSTVEKVTAKDPAADEPIEDRSVADEEEILSERKKKFDFWCDICAIGTFSQVVMEAHLQGKKHRTKFQKLSAAILTATMLPPKAPQEAQLKNPMAEEEKNPHYDPLVEDDCCK